MPGARRGSLLGGKRDSILASIGGSVGYGYGTLFGLNRSQETLDGDEGAVEGEGDGGFWEVGGWVGGLRDVWIHPRQGAVRRVVEVWWRRWAVLIVLPAAIVSSAFPRWSFCCGVGYDMVMRGYG